MAAIIKWLTADEATQSSCVHVELFDNAFATALLPERRAVPWPSRFNETAVFCASRSQIAMQMNAVRPSTEAATVRACLRQTRCYRDRGRCWLLIRPLSRCATPRWSEPTDDAILQGRAHLTSPGVRSSKHSMTSLHSHDQTDIWFHRRINVFHWEQLV